jgi:hypothetical protein
MDSNAILHEVQQLYNVSDRLDSLAKQHSIVAEGTPLEVLFHCFERLPVSAL